MLFLSFFLKVYAFFFKLKSNEDNDSQCADQHLCFFFSHGSICSHPQQECWLKDICQDSFSNNDFWNSQESSYHSFLSGIFASHIPPLGWTNWHLRAQDLLSPRLWVGVITWWINCSHTCCLGPWNFSEAISVPTCEKMATSKIRSATALIFIINLFGFIFKRKTHKPLVA